MIGVALVTILVFALVGQAAWLATDAWRDREPIETPVARRLVDYTRITWEKKSVDTKTILRRQRVSRFPWLDKLLVRFEIAQRLSRDLSGAGQRVKATEFLMIQLATTLFAGLAAFVALPQFLGGFAPAIAGAVLGFVAPMLWLRRAHGKRLQGFEEGLPDALDLLTGSLRAGYSTPDAMEIVARESRGPCAEEFAEVIQELNLGGDLEVALNRLLGRVPTEDNRLFVGALVVQRRTGGNLVDVLKQLARTLRERRRLRDDVKVLTTGPRVSGYVAGALPFIMLAGMYLINRRSYEILISEPVGIAVIAGSAVLVVIGLVLNHRISQVDV